ncbi:hypothetical protein [uncultured Deefgea sp.]|uniref:hypothetical protein n=1 Tax=uncultured Deefgea sp. TaxID=1304914 RepID=UPI00261EE4B7|nr:hypothetical protein [uncultured Deefgea sp.]
MGMNFNAAAHGRAVVADAEKALALVRWVAIRGGFFLITDIGMAPCPRVQICSKRSKRLIEEIKQQFTAEIMGRSYGSQGEQQHWQAEINGGLILWVEYSGDSNDRVE